MSDKQVCEKCNAVEVEAYQYPDGREAYLCQAHADEDGFCPGCHFIMLGADDDHQGRTGLCYNCWQDLKAEVGEDDEYSDWDDSEY